MMAGRSAIADPTTPQLSPIHLQREDAQRVADQQRTLDRDNPPPTTMPGAQLASEPAKPAMLNRSKRNAGLAFLGIAGISAVVSIPLLATDESSVGGAAAHNFATITIATAVAASVIGIVLYSSSRVPMQIAPSLTPRSAGVSLFGRL